MEISPRPQTEPQPQPQPHHLDPEQPQQSPSQHAQPRRRRRPALSCRECRRRKIKCDQNNPCAHCARHNVQCTYQLYRNDSEPIIPVRYSQAPARLSTASPAPSAPGLAIPISSSHSMTQIQGQQRLAPSQTDICIHDRSSLDQSHRDQANASQPATATTSHGVPTPASSSRNQCHCHGHEVQDLLQRIKKLEASAMSQGHESTTAHSPLSEIDRNPPKRQYPDEAQGWQAMLSKSRDLGKGDWTGAAQELAAVIACWGEIMGMPSKNTSFRDPETAALVTQAGDMLKKCKKTAKSIKLVRPTRSLSTSSDFLTPPPRELSDTLANLYFQSFESTHRILHIPTFWADYRRFWDQPETVTADLRLTVLLVIGIGSSLLDHGTPEAALHNMELVHHWIYAAETWLAGPLEKDRVDIVGLQIYCLTILARQIFSIGGDTVWMSMGSLIHRAMQIGLHRDPQNLPVHPVPILQAEIRRRLWATILDLAVQASLDSRMPPRISLDEFDTKPPSNIDDAEIDESTTVVQPHPRGQFTATSIQLTLLDSFPARLRTVQLVNGFRTEISYQRILALSSELTDALQMNISFMRNDTKCTAFHRNLLDYLVRRFIIPLHFSFSNQARSNPVYHYSLKLSLDTAIAIMSPEQDAQFSRLMASGGGLFREGLRIATTATGLELLVHTQSQHLDGTLQRITQYRELLKKTVRDMISLSEERIRQGETNVKTHMLLSMILAQVEAIEADLPVERQLARSARESLEYCYSILRTRVDKMSLVSTPDAGLATTRTGIGQGLEVCGLDLDWTSFLPDEDFFSGMTM